MKNDAEVTSRTISWHQTVVPAAEDSALFLKNDAKVTTRTISGLKTIVQPPKIVRVFSEIMREILRALFPACYGSIIS